MRMTHVLTLLALFAGLAVANDGAAAYQDQLTQPSTVRHITTATAGGLQRMQQQTALAFVIASTSRQPNLDYCRPVRIGATLWRIDLAQLGWSEADWDLLVADYPYHPTGSKTSTLVRADWLIEQLTDQTESDAYLRFVFGKKVLTRDDALKILAVDFNRSFAFGLIQGQSGVSVSGTRWIENRPISRGYAWGTRDSLVLDAKSDPLERPDGSFEHNGEEWIVGLPKFDPRTGYRGALQVYFLSDGKGNIVDRAPVDLVRDHNEFRGLAEIRNPGSCIGCHQDGINAVGPNQLAETIKSGVEAYADYANYQAIEQFHFSDLDKEVKRNNEDFFGAAILACGEPPAEASLCVSSVVAAYDAPVTLERAAAESYIAPEELKRALALGSAGGYSLGARLSGLAHGRTVPREAFEDGYATVRGLAEYWRKSQ